MKTFLAYTAAGAFGIGLAGGIKYVFAAFLIAVMTVTNQ